MPPQDFVPRDTNYIETAAAAGVCAMVFVMGTLACGVFWWIQARRKRLSGTVEGIPPASALILGIMTALAAICLFLCAGLSGYRFFESKSYNARLEQEVVEPCRDIVAQCRADFPQETIPTPRGRVLVWDDHVDERGHWPTWPILFQRVKDRAQPDDPELTVCLLVSSKDVEVDAYVNERTHEPLGIKALETHFEVCVVHWPSLEPMGRFTAIGFPPPKAEARYKHGRSGRYDEGLIDTILDQLATGSSPMEDAAAAEP